MDWFSAVLLVGLTVGILGGVVYSLTHAVVKPRIRTLLLDADGTLLDFDLAEKHALEEAFATMGYPFDESVREAYHFHNQACWKRLEAGEITREELKPLRFAQVFAQLDMDGDADAIWPVYEKALGNYSFVYDGVEDACARLSKKYNLILVTNGTKAVQTPRLLQTRIPEFLKGIYVSEDVGYAKPAPEFFQRVFDDHPKLKRCETMIVGDSLSGDIAGGIGAGIRTCWVNRTGAPRPEGMKIDLEIDDFTKLEKEL